MPSILDRFPTSPFIAVLIAAALVDVAHGGELAECEPQRVTGDGRHWAYRIIDGRECWYPGEPGKPKSQLFWSPNTIPSAGETVDRPETKADPSSELQSTLAATPPEEPAAWPTIEAGPSSAPQPGFAASPLEEPNIEMTLEEWRAIAADQLLAFTCCWPELEELPMPKEGQPPPWPLIALLPLALALWRLLEPRPELTRTGSSAPVRLARDRGQSVQGT
jgi:hypothetical protein